MGAFLDVPGMPSTGHALAEETPERHCTIRLEPSVNGEPSKTSDFACFSTFAEAMRYGSQGRVVLPADFRARDLTQQMLDEQLARGGGDGEEGMQTESCCLLSIEYDLAFYQGSTLEVWSGHAGCDSTHSYANPTLPPGFDNWISSADGYSGCDNVEHFSNQWYGGTSQMCDCLGMVNSNATSSITWDP
jgi:hypothetical protein